MYKISNFLDSETPLWLVELYILFRKQNKIKLVWRLRKGEDQALISVSTILKFAAQEDLYRFWKKTYWLFFFRRRRGGGSLHLEEKNLLQIPQTHNPTPPIICVHAHFQRWSCMATRLVPNLWKNYINITLNIEYVQNRWEGAWKV